MLRSLRAQLSPQRGVATHTVDEVAQALDHFARIGTDTLFTVGGDGTTTRTLTELVRVWPRPRRPAWAA